MDDMWERKIPFLSIDLTTVKHLFRQYDPAWIVSSFSPLKEGKRNTNYVVRTIAPERRFLLRIFPSKEEGWHMEKTLRSRLAPQVPLQTLFHIGHDDAIGNRFYAIYEYAEGVSLLEATRAGYVPNEELFDRLGRVLAAIHRHPYDRAGFLNEGLEVAQELPPLETWFELFLNDRARRRLGSSIATKIEQLVQDNVGTLRDIDSRYALVHGDFRPTNLLVHQGKLSCVLDWEFATALHPIADFGQLFRYDDQFAPHHKQALIRAYEAETGTPLPSDWEQRGRLRDLANLVQMIGDNEDFPDKYADLRQLIERTLVQMA